MAARTERPEKKQENYLHRRKESYMASANNQQCRSAIKIFDIWIGATISKFPKQELGYCLKASGRCIM